MSSGTRSGKGRCLPAPAAAGRGNRSRCSTAPGWCFKRGDKKLPHPPVVVGFGPAGMFAGLSLAREGYCPIILERGADVDSRVEAVNRFWKEGRLDTATNVQFGEGGAGTFSDGKLTTRISDPRCSFILEEMIRHGAPEEIRYPPEAARRHRSAAGHRQVDPRGDYPPGRAGALWG